MRVLFVVPYAPTRIRSRAFHLIRALAADGHRLTVATLWSTEAERAAVADLQALDHVDEVIAEPLPVSARIRNCLCALPTTQPLQAHYCWCPTLQRHLARRVDQHEYDVVHVEHLRGVRYGLALRNALGRPGPRPALVWDAVDCISTLCRRASRESATLRARLVARLELSRTERYEAVVRDRFDRVLLTSEADRRDLCALSDGSVGPNRGARIDVLAQGVDCDYFSPSDGPREPATLVITGKMSYHVNATAVLWFAHRVMPLIWQKRPGVHLWIVGQGPPPEVVRLARVAGDARSRVRVTREVDDVRPFLRTATVAVAPIQYSVGVQNKILEALACETPVLATPQAVASLDVTVGRELETASTPHAMARAALSLLENSARRAELARAGRTFVERRHDWSQIRDALTHIYRAAVREVGDG